jgi:hypothetical protein
LNLKPIRALVRRRWWGFGPGGHTCTITPSQSRRA